MWTLRVKNLENGKEVKFESQQVRDMLAIANTLKDMAAVAYKAYLRKEN